MKLLITSFTVFLSLICYSNEIVPHKKFIDVYNPHLSTKLMKDKGYLVRTKTKKNYTPSLRELDGLIKKAELSKYTKGFDSIAKQILVHRLLNYNITQLVFYYPYIGKKNFEKAKENLE